MRRPGRLIAGCAGDRLAPLPGMAIAGIFIGVSGLACVSFGYKLGEPSGNAWVFAALALGIESYADLAVPLFWRRVRWLGRAMLLAFFALCLAYKLTAANRFAVENLGKREVAMASAATDYDLARNKVEALRKTISANGDARPAGIIQAEIDGLLRDPRTDGCQGKINGEVTAKVCPKVDALRTELARAEARTMAEAGLPAAIHALQRKPPIATGATDSAGAVGSLLSFMGYHVTSWSELVAQLIMLIIEAGAIVVPMLVGLAFGDPREPRAKGAPSDTQALQRPPTTLAETGEASPPQISLRRITDRGGRDITELTDFLGDCTERAAGEQVQATALYLRYCGWKTAGAEPVSLAQFGTVLTQHLGLTKAKLGGKIHYINIRLKAPQTAAASLSRSPAIGNAKERIRTAIAPLAGRGPANEKAA